MKPEIIGDATLYLGDCLEILPTLDKVDAVVTDPPYGVKFKGRAGVHEEITNDHKGFNVSPYIAVALKVLRRGRHIYVFGPLDISKLPLCSAAEIIWDKENFGLGDLTLPWGPSHEKITFAVYETSKVNREKGFGKLSARLRRGSVIRCLRPHSVRANVHPTEKPVEVIQQLVESSSIIGETILDPFMGSGTTGVVCAKLGRKFIGIEIEPKYFDIACQRIQKAYDQPDLFIEPPKKAEQHDLALKHNAG